MCVLVRSIVLRLLCFYLCLIIGKLPVAEISRGWAGTQTADHGRRFLKTSKYELSAMSLFSEFHWSVVRTKLLRCRSRDVFFVFVVVICSGPWVCWDKRCRWHHHSVMNNLIHQDQTLICRRCSREASPTSWVLQWHCCVCRNRLPRILPHADWLSPSCSCSSVDTYPRCHHYMP